MCDLCTLIFGLVVDLFRSRAALEAEVLVLKQQIIVLRRGKHQIGCHFWLLANRCIRPPPSVSSASATAFGS
jgi:hypothetical protein